MSDRQLCARDLPISPEASAAVDAVEVLRPGFLTTVQDRGRMGYQQFGVPVSGAADEGSYRVANLLVGNPPGSAALEITALGPQLRFQADGVVALTGAEVQAELEGGSAPWYRSFQVRRGQVLDVRNCTGGLRAYLAFAGGVQVPILLGSRSTCLVARFGGLHGRALAAGDVLTLGSPGASLSELSDREVSERWRPRCVETVTVRVVLGPQDDAFTEEGLRTFLESSYRVTQYTDRMGCRLDGPRIAHRGPADLLSDWIPPGGVQVPGNGQPIILLADRQTTGGYTKIATVIGPDIGLVAQRRPGEWLRFQVVSPTEAQQIAREVEAAFASLPRAVSICDGWRVAAELGEVPGVKALRGAGGVTRSAAPLVDEAGRTIVRSPMWGVVLQVCVAAGGVVAEGTPLFVLQAMKMEVEVVAPRAGWIAAIQAGEGDTVAAGDPMGTIESSDGHSGTPDGGDT